MLKVFQTFKLYKSVYFFSLPLIVIRPTSWLSLVIRLVIKKDTTYSSFLQQKIDASSNSSSNITCSLIMAKCGSRAYVDSGCCPQGPFIDDVTIFQRDRVKLVKKSQPICLSLLSLQISSIDSTWTGDHLGHIFRCFLGGCWHHCVSTNFCVFEKPNNQKQKQKTKQNVIFQLRQFSIFFDQNFMDWSLGQQN